MAYGKLEDGQLVLAPNPLHLRNGEVYNPSGYLYTAVGYKLIVYTPMPKDPANSSAFTAHWEERDGEIIRVWTETGHPAAAAPKPADCAGEEQAAL